MKKDKLTDRQQFKKWIEEDMELPPDELERVLTYIFEVGMNYKKKYPDLKLRTLYACGHMTYMEGIARKEVMKLEGLKNGKE